MIPRRRVIILCLLALFLAATGGLYAAIFASDGFFLYLAGERVAGDSVIVTGKGLHAPEVCGKGALWLRQNISGEGLELFFHLTGGDVPAEADWLRARRETAPEAGAEDYLAFLREKAASAAKTVKVTVPSLADSPALRPTPAQPPREGMTGGLIGSYRYFRIDLDTGGIAQVEQRPQE